ncbi:MAG: dihydroorotase [Bacillota bacterium]
MYDLALKHGRIYYQGQFTHKHIYIEDEKIALITDQERPAKTVFDATGKDVLPGIIDPHVHFALNVGSQTSVDDFYHGTVSGAFGGVTTIIDFLDPVRNADELIDAYHQRCEAAKDSVIDYAFHATLKAPNGSLETFVKTMKSLHIHTLKVFTTYSESGRQTQFEDIKTLLKLTKKYNFLLMVHVENDAMISLDPAFTVKDLPKSRPEEAEITEALNLAALVKETGGKLYMVHTSSGRTIEALKVYHESILNTQFFIESCPQYFLFTEKNYHASDGYLYTCAPPLRDDKAQAKLFNNIELIDTIGTDHCSFLSHEKQRKRLIDIPLGLGGIEHSFVVMHHLFGDQIINKMTTRVAQLHQLKDKGKIDIGYDADFMVMMPKNGFPIRETHTASDYDLYLGHPGSGLITDTIVRGQFVVKNRQLIIHSGHCIERCDLL